MKSREAQGHIERERSSILFVKATNGQATEQGWHRLTLKRLFFCVELAAACEGKARVPPGVHCVFWFFVFGRFRAPFFFILDVYNAASSCLFKKMFVGKPYDLFFLCITLAALSPRDECVLLCFFWSQPASDAPRCTLLVQTVCVFLFFLLRAESFMGKQKSFLFLFLWCARCSSLRFSLFFPHRNVRIVCWMSFLRIERSGTQRQENKTKVGEGNKL